MKCRKTFLKTRKNPLLYSKNYITTNPYKICSIHTMKETLIFFCVEGTVLLFTLVFLQFGGGVLKDNPKPCIYENACE